MSEDESARMSGDHFGNVRLLRDIEEISKALYLHNVPPRASIREAYHLAKSTDETRLKERESKYFNDGLIQNGKRSSIWNWKPLKALTHIRNHKLSGYFFLHIHSIEGLPLNFNGLSLRVHWKRKDEVLESGSVQVHEGMAEFEETLMHRCSVYVSKSGPEDDVARYAPKLCLLYASVVGAPGLDIGKHWIDLTRLLPLTLMELEEEKNRNGKWMTSFKLMGKAQGATINVSFGFSLSWDDVNGSTNLRKIPNILKGSGTSRNGMLRRLGSIPSNSSHRTHVSSPSLDIKAHNGILPYTGSSITFLYQLLDEAKSNHSKDFNLISTSLDSCDLEFEFSPKTKSGKLAYENDDNDFTVIDQGVEFATKDKSKTGEDDVKAFESSAIETINVAEIFEADEDSLDKEIEDKVNDEACGILRTDNAGDDVSSKENILCAEESAIEELELFFHNLSTSESSELDSSFHKSQFLDQENCMRNSEIEEGAKMSESHSLDDFTDPILNDFMNLLGSDSEPESPRERLLRQFEKEALTSGNFLFNSNDVEGQGDYSNTSGSSFLIQGAQMEHDGGMRPSLISRRKAEMLENLETEALMQEWGLNERAFQNSPRTDSGAFGSPVYLSPEKLPELPPLGEGLHSLLRTKNGGFLRSMNPSLFKSAKNGERLIMQVSSPVVLAAAMGSNGMDILQKWATIGAETMLLQATQLMPMEEIAGKTLQQVAWEAASETEVLGRRHELMHESEAKSDLYNIKEEANKIFAGICCEVDSEYVPPGAFAPLAMEKIQYLLIECLRIQSGTSNVEPPSSISVHSIGGNLASTSKSIIIGSSSNFIGDLDNVDELIGMSLSLNEWMRLDSGSFDTECELSDRVSKILAAHCAKIDLTRFNKYGELSDQNGGCFGDNLTLALQVLLRDPLRDHEPVGISMLALIQVERKYVEKNNTEYDTEYDLDSPLFKITEVHVAGFKAEPGKQQQSGSRWLLSSGMTGKMKRHPLSKSNAIVRSTSRLIKKTKHEDVLWSISSYVHGAVSKWKELSELSLHVVQRLWVFGRFWIFEVICVFKSNAIVRSTSRLIKKTKHEDVLWSISSYVHGAVSKWKELSELSLHVRNPDILFK